MEQRTGEFGILKWPCFLCPTVADNCFRRGSTYAHALARLGADVIAVDNSEKVNETVDDIRKNGGEATACIGAASLAAVLKKLDRLDIVIATSTAPESGRVDNNSEDTWSRITAASFDSVYKIIRTAWPFLLRNSRGKVVIEINPIGLYGESGQAAYSSSVGFPHPPESDGSN